MKLTSGSLNFDSGVGTQIEIASASRRQAPSLVAMKRSPFRIEASCATETSFTWERPAIRPSTTRRLTSKPITRYPACASSTASGSPTQPSPMMPNSASRRSALAIKSSATDIRAFSPITSVIESGHRPHHIRLLILPQLRIDRKRDDLRRGGLGGGKAPGPVPKMAEAGLQVQGQGIVHRTPDAAGPQGVQQRVPPGNPHRVLVKDVLVGRVHGGRNDAAAPGEGRAVGGRLLAPRRAPALEERQLGEQDRRLERIEAAVGAHLVVMILPGAAVEPEPGHPLRERV